MLIINQKKAAAPGVITPLTLGTPLVGYDTHEPDAINFIGTGVDGDNISDFVDLTGNGWDASQGTGSAQPEILTVSGKRCASFTHAQTIISSAITSLGATDFTVVLVGSVVTRTGTPATSDALYSIAGTGEETRLEAGNTSTFLSHYNNTGTGFADLNGTSADLVNGGFQLFSYENGSAAQTAWLMNEVRATGAATGVHDASVNLTIGSNLAFTFRAMWIYDGVLTAADHLSLANYYATEQSMTMVAGSWESRNTAVPTHDNVSLVGSNVTGTAGTWLNARNTANSLTYQWYNNGDAGNATGTGNATLVYTIAAADEGDTLKLIETNTVLSVANTADSANTSTVTVGLSNFSDLSSAIHEYDASDESASSITEGTTPDVINWQDQIGTADLDDVSGTITRRPHTAQTADDINSLNTLSFTSGNFSYIRQASNTITGTADMHFFFVVRIDAATTSQFQALVSCGPAYQDGFQIRHGNSGSTFSGDLDSDGAFFTSAASSHADRTGVGLWEAVFDSTAGTATLFHEGTQIAQATDYGTTDDFAGQVMKMNVGSEGAVLNNLTCNVAHIGVCNEVLSTADQTSARNFFNDKWGTSA